MFYNIDQSLWSLLSCVYTTLGELGDVNHSLVQSRWEKWRTHCFLGLSTWPFRSRSEALPLLYSSQLPLTNLLWTDKMDGWMDDGWEWLHRCFHSEGNGYSELTMEVKGGILGQYIPLKYAVQMCDSLPHGRVGISIAQYPFRPLGILYGENQGQTFILFLKNEAETKSWLCFFHLSKKKREGN